MHCGVFFSVLPFGKLPRFLSSVPEDDLYIRISGGVVLERDINGKKYVLVLMLLTLLMFGYLVPEYLG
jgi:hypothetical protein